MEAALLERVAEIMTRAGRDYDRVIFDTAPTGHTVRLLSLPDIMAAWTDGLLGHRERSARLGAALRHLGGGRVKGDELSRLESAADHEPGSRDAQLDDLLQARRRKFIHARGQLLDLAQTAFISVLNPDRLSVLETARAHEILRRFSIPVTAVVVNRVLPEDADGAFLAARREQEARYLAKIDRCSPGYRRCALPCCPTTSTTSTPFARWAGASPATKPGRTLRRTLGSGQASPLRAANGPPCPSLALITPASACRLRVSALPRTLRETAPCR